MEGITDYVIVYNSATGVRTHAHAENVEVHVYNFLTKG